MLCVTFTALQKDKSWRNILRNVKYAKERCEWVVVSYNSVDEVLYSSRLTVIEEVALWANTSAMVMRHSFGDRDGLMKPLLFDALLPFLRLYSKVWLMDEDISIVGFNFRSYFGIWDCAFDPASPPPVISQPLIHGNKYQPPFTKDGWAMYNNSVIAIRSAWVEQQSPILDARFFAWFIENVIFPLKNDFIETKSDFGYDQTWFIMADNYVNHKDFKTIVDWHAKRVEWLTRSEFLITAFRIKFPNTFYDGFRDGSFFDKKLWYTKSSGTCKHKPFMMTIPDKVVETPQIRYAFLSYTFSFMMGTMVPTEFPAMVPEPDDTSIPTSPTLQPLNSSPSTNLSHAPTIGPTFPPTSNSSGSPTITNPSFSPTVVSVYSTNTYSPTLIKSPIFSPSFVPTMDPSYSRSTKPLSSPSPSTQPPNSLTVTIKAPVPASSANQSLQYNNPTPLPVLVTVNDTFSPTILSSIVIVNRPLSSSTSESLSSGEIAGIVIGAVFAALLLCIMVIFCCIFFRRRKSSGAKIAPAPPELFSDIADDENPPPDTLVQFERREYEEAELF
eukprot:gene23758-32144_t